MPQLQATHGGRGLTDTHCHLNHEQFMDDAGEALLRARAAGIERLLVVGYDLTSSRAALALAEANTDVQAVIGIHPEAAGEWSERAVDELLGMVADHRANIAAWGEIGLDYHWESSSRIDQKAVFEAQLDFAASAGLSAVIHCRDAYDDVLDLLAAKNFHNAVLHCFTGTSIQAARGIKQGHFLGIGGIATFKNAGELREIYADEAIPLSRLLLETDAPYLAPQPMRGKRNEPSYIVAVAELLASLRGCSVAEIAEQTSRNADALFGSMRHEDFVDG